MIYYQTIWPCAVSSSIELDIFTLIHSDILCFTLFSAILLAKIIERSCQFKLNNVDRWWWWWWLYLICFELFILPKKQMLYFLKALQKIIIFTPLVFGCMGNLIRHQRVTMGGKRHFTLESIRDWHIKNKIFLSNIMWQNCNTLLILTNKIVIKLPTFSWSELLFNFLFKMYRVKNKQIYQI